MYRSNQQRLHSRILCYASRIKYNWTKLNNCEWRREMLPYPAIASHVNMVLIRQSINLFRGHATVTEHPNLWREITKYLLRNQLWYLSTPTYSMINLLYWPDWWHAPRTEVSPTFQGSLLVLFSCQLYDQPCPKNKNKN